MAQRRRSRGFTALKVEGGILQSEFLQTVASLKAPDQTDADYGLSQSLAIKEELARYWRIAKDLHQRYSARRCRDDLAAPQVGVKDWLLSFLDSVLGYNDLTVAGQTELGGRIFPLTHRACEKAVPLLLTTHDFDLDRASVLFGQDGRRAAPQGVMQEYLNAEDDALWGIVSNGTRLRVLRDNVSLTRTAYIEADLDLMFDEELYPDFTALWLCVHASRLRPINQKPAGCIIESWRRKAEQTGERVRNDLRTGVTDALRSLGNGFLEHPTNDTLREKLKSGKLSTEGYFQQLLRLVYRLLFLFASEERDLLLVPETTDEQRGVFTEGYALSRLRERAMRRRHYDDNRDLWQGMLITFGALAKGAPALGLPALGGLFREDQCSHLDCETIANGRLLKAIHSLAFFTSKSGLSRINYRDMDTEELGSVYESLLDLRPVVDVKPWAFGFVGEGGKTIGSERKLTGSYYTPQSLVKELIRSTLEPVIRQTIDAHPQNPRAAILALKVVDPACGSGHFLLAAARRLAAEVARLESGDDSLDETARRHALREVIQHCIYGVDRNPLAVELCKTALWIETIEPGKPLNFLDAHILQGDSLVGVLDPEIMADGIPSDAYKPLAGDDKAVCRDLKKRNSQPHTRGLFDEDAVLEVAVTSLDINAMPENTLEEVEQKRAQWKSEASGKNRVRELRRANLFTGAYFAPKQRENLDIVPQTRDLQSGDDLPQRRGVEEFAQTLADQHSFFHWHLAFADIMQDDGFDVVLGNPPWEVSQLNEQEFFAVKAPSISSLPGAERKRKIAQLEDTDSQLWSEYQDARYGFNARNCFFKSSGRYSLITYRKLNNYALFAETILQLLNPSGRAGIIVPTGIATDDSTKVFFDHIISRKRLASLFDFENREKVFPGIDSRIKFCLLTLNGEKTPADAEFAFFLHQVDQLKEAERRFTLNPEDFTLFNPNTRTCPIFRTRRDMEIARKMYQRAGVLWKEGNGSTESEVNPWGIRFMQMFNMTSDSGLFRTRQQMEDDGWVLEGNNFMKDDNLYLPLYEAKLFHQYDHRFATFAGVSERDIKKGKARLMEVAEKSDPKAVAIPRYWVHAQEVAERLDKSRMIPQLQTAGQQDSRTAGQQDSRTAGQQDSRTAGQQDSRTAGQQDSSNYTALRLITRATDQRTMLCTIIPNSALGHKAAILRLEGIV